MVFLISSLNCGGAEKVCVSLANRLTNKGRNVEVAVLNLKKAVLHSELDSKVKLTDLRIKEARYGLFKMYKYMRQHKSDKVLVFNHQLAVMLVLIRSLFRLNYVIVARNISTLSQKHALDRSFWRRCIVHTIVKKFYRNVDRIIAQSSGMKDDLLRNYKITDAKCTVIYNTVNPAIENFVRDQNIGGYQKKKYVLCVGRLEKPKAYHRAIEVFAKVSQNDSSLSLVFVGTGSMHPDLKQLACEYGVSEKVKFEGLIKDVIPYYLAAKLTLLTSFYEGFPNVLIESITLGTPVVAFDCMSGPSEIVVDGINGFLVKNGDMRELESAINRTLEKKWNPFDVAATADRFKSERIVKEYEHELFA